MTPSPDTADIEDLKSFLADYADTTRSLAYDFDEGRIDANTYTQAIIDKTAKAESSITAYITKREQKYQEIFTWLLGENGEFPESEKGKRYNWRPELRNRLKALQNSQADESNRGSNDG